jgi:hypothetical protein
MSSRWWRRMIMATPELQTASLTGLEVVSSSHDLRRDLHIFARYVQEREVKRTHRGNLLPKSDALRLAAILGDAPARAEVEEQGRSEWIDSLDHLALLLKFVEYDTEGTYVGYTSSEPSYPDNYISFDDERYAGFLRKSPQDQENTLLSTLLEEDEKGENEFYERGPLGRLDRFDRRGCAIGVVPTLSFLQIRRRLLELLAPLEIGVWYRTDSLVEFLKRKDPFFLIPEVLPKNALKEGKDRYQNFRERKGNEYGKEEQITEKSPHAFERVEGRYVERFLEGIPLALGYVEVAYSKGKTGDIHPSLGKLAAFRLTEIFGLAMRSRIAAPRVVVLPNFEVHVDSPMYPAGVISKLIPLCELVSEGPHTVFKLDRTKVAEVAAAGDCSSAAGLLRDLASGEVPPNVDAELKAWTQRSEVFTLYEGFGLLETKDDPAAAQKFIVERIGPGLAVVRSPEEVFKALEKAERVPQRIQHREAVLLHAPAGSSSLFAEERQPKAAAEMKPKAVLKRSVLYTLRFPDAAMLEAFRKAALDLNHVFAVEAKSLSVTYSRKDEETVRAALEKLKPQRDFRIEDERT